jgi:acetyl-CoA carboxylase carboxyltransferase component
VHERSGVSDFTVADDPAAALLVRDLLAHLPSSASEAPPWRPPAPPRVPLTDDAVPLEARKAYDVRTVAAGLVDDGDLLEVTPRWARNLLTAFARLDGRPVGVIANNPHHLGGVLDAESAQKGCRFVRTCNAFGLPLIVLVDTPGFLPGSKQEKGAVIRHGATLVHAFAEARVPKLTVVLRKAFGGALIAMNAKGLGADLVLAWPDAKLGVMGAEQAVGVLHRRASAEERAALAETYAAEHLTAVSAAASGHIDEVVAPAETRDRLATALALFGGGGG